MAYQCLGCDDVRCDCQPEPETLDAIVFGMPTLTAEIIHEKGLGRWVIVKEVETDRVWGEPIKVCSGPEAVKRLFEVRRLFGIDVDGVA